MKKLDMVCFLIINIITSSKNY